MSHLSNLRNVLVAVALSAGLSGCIGLEFTVYDTGSDFTMFEQEEAPDGSTEQGAGLGSSGLQGPAQLVDALPEQADDEDLPQDDDEHSDDSEPPQDDSEPADEHEHTQHDDTEDTGAATSSEACEGVDHCDMSCPAGNCDVECSGTSSCSSTCAGGGCVQVCEHASSCHFGCVGGNCLMACTDASICSMTCEGGGCTFDCDTVGSCTTDCPGGGCS